jgi:DNA-directed RNA polymerase specialized sigma24 family protein
MTRSATRTCCGRGFCASPRVRHSGPSVGFDEASVSIVEIVVAGTDLAERIDVREALRALPQRTRAAVALHHLAGLSVRETADALGVSENTIKTQLKSGLETLREVLRDG